MLMRKLEQKEKEMDFEALREEFDQLERENQPGTLPRRNEIAAIIFKEGKMPRMITVDRQDVEDLLGMVQRFCPTGTEQEACAQVVRSMQAAGHSHREVAVALSRVLHDGLEHGNWPAF